MALNASVLLRAENTSVHRTTASVNQAARTCTVVFYQGGINRLQNLRSRWPPQKPWRKVVVVFQRTPRSTGILSCAVAPVTLLTILSSISARKQEGMCITNRLHHELDSPRLKSLGRPGHEISVSKLLPLGHHS